MGRSTGAGAGVQAGTGQPDAPVLKPGRHHRACAGYGTTIRPGLVRVGDPVTIAAMT